MNFLEKLGDLQLVELNALFVLDFLNGLKGKRSSFVLLERHVDALITNNKMIF